MEDEDMYDNADEEYERMREDEYERVEEMSKELVEILYSKMIIGIFKIQQDRQNSLYWRGRSDKLVDEIVRQVKYHFVRGEAMKEMLKKLKDFETLNK
jgi:hypothetical protein